MPWTEKQEQVIKERDKTILVSAAAGSGKTATLVERIYQKMIDPEHPVDITSFLVVTFTKAAAAQMKEKLLKKLEEAQEQYPESEHIAKQNMLIQSADITTIDSFCLNIVKEYFSYLNLDPAVGIGDPGMLEMLKYDVMTALFEEKYAQLQEQGDTEFGRLLEVFCDGKRDENLKDVLDKIYRQITSFPAPERFLEEARMGLQIDTAEDLNHAPWMQAMLDILHKKAAAAVQLAERCLVICEEPDGPNQYREQIESDIEKLQAIGQADSYAAMKGAIESKWATLSRKKFTGDKELQEACKTLRKEYKDEFDSKKLDSFKQSEAQILEDMQLLKTYLLPLLSLTEEFMTRFMEEKQKRKMLEFSDISHMAYQLVCAGYDEDGTAVPTEIGKTIANRYEEIYIDEYQDSNYLQEDILTAVSGKSRDVHNMFMVGDVKQSIYRFRLARPELFMEKYKSYSTEEAQEQRIDLHKNFRSREQVLESVNFIFRQIMGEDLGGITYDKDAALYPGASFPEGESEEFVKTEVLLVERDGEELSDVQDYEDAGASGNRREMENQTGQELEALAIAQRIKEIVGKEQIVDKETKEYRPVEYGDIVILLRTAYGWAETFREVLASQGIPVYCTSRTGYFSATEIVTVLNYLKVCDNPLQDIPLMGVLRSPIVGCTSQELAELRIQYPDGLLYESVSAYAGENEIPEKELDPDKLKSELLNSNLRTDEKNSLNIKLKGFLSLLEKVRNMAAYTPVHELILYVLKETGYGDYARALPGGEQRFANLTMLVEKAMDYEKTSYRGLFNFVRYIEQLQAYQVDYGEVNLTGAGNTAVEIMTIHKSKGLEFPVVFVAGMGKQFNFQDMNAGLLLHPELGIGADAIIPEKRVIASSLNKQVIRRQLLKESLGEELRVLYVAMTRAKEKLILTGTVGKLEKQMLSLSRFLDEEEELLPLGTRMKAKNYWAFVLPALVRHRAMSELLWEYGILMKKQPGIYDDISEFVIKKITVRQMTEKAVLIQAGNQMQEEYLKNWDENKVYDEAVKEEIEKRFSFVYPYKYLEDIPVKVSVSDLKKRSWHDESELEENISVSAEEQEEEQEAPVPAFMAEKQEEYKGAARGTAYHRVMECLDYAEADTEEQLRAQLKRLLESQKMTEQEAECIRIRDIRRFVESGLGQRMKKAAMKKHLYREQPFVIQRSASMLDDGWKNETVLVQGIIDAYFMEEEEIVLVDYKTDRVKRGQEQKLIDLYHVQLEDYARALERMTGKRVKEKIIYSFTLQKEILL